LFNQSLLLAGLLGCAFTVLLLALRQPYSTALAGDAVTARLAVQFLGFFIPALGLQFLMMTLSAALRGVGDVRTAATTQIASIALNIVLAPILIFGWLTGVRLGIAGASLATLISLSAGVAGLLLHLRRRGRHYDPQLRAWLPQLRVWAQIARIGVASGAEFALLGLYMTFVMWILRPFGAPAQAAFGIGQRWLQFGMMPCMAIGFSSAAIVGQNYGARLMDRVRATFANTAIGCLLGVSVFFVLFHLCPMLLLEPFTHTPAVLDFGLEYLHILSWNLVVVAMAFACGGVFSGIGNTVPSLLASGSRIVFIVIPVTLLSRHPGFRPRWIWELSVGGSVLQLAVNLLFLRREFRGRLSPQNADPALAEHAPAG
jgi:putative MATE family efflux protein